MLVGTALAVIIPEGIRSLYEGSGRTLPVIHETEHTQTIGLSLVLGFVFMMMVDVSQRRSNIGNDSKNSATLTLGLVVHAAGTITHVCMSICYTYVKFTSIMMHVGDTIL